MGIILLLLRFFESALLYLFLGFVLYFLYQISTKGSFPIQKDSSYKVIIHAKEQLTGQTRDFEFTNKNSITFGSSAESMVRLNDASVSTHHAKIIRINDEWYIEDQNSINGTFINEKRVLSTNVISSNDIIRLADVTITLELMTE